MTRVAVTVVVAVVLLTGSGARQDTRDGEWRATGGDPGGQRFSPLTQINRSNVGALREAWAFGTGSTGLQATPLVVGGMMYVTAGNAVFALEPETGKRIWTFDAGGVVSRRGVAYWPGDGSSAPRLYTGDHES